MARYVALSPILTVLAAAALIVAGPGSRAAPYPAAATIPATPTAPGARAGLATAFSLTDPAGRHVTDRHFRGRFMLVYFGYTTCPGHCPTMLAMVAAALKTLGEREREVHPIFITVDPEHDTPAIMGRFTGRFGRRILGLTGSPAQIESVEKGYGVQILFRRTGPAAGAYLIDHPSVLYLVGPDGRFIAKLQTDGGANDLAADIRQRLPVTRAGAIARPMDRQHAG